MADAKYDYGLGRRKSATARARLTKGKGDITINGKTAAEYLADNKTLLCRNHRSTSDRWQAKEFDVSILLRVVV